MCMVATSGLMQSIPASVRRSANALVVIDFPSSRQAARFLNETASALESLTNWLKELPKEYAPWREICISLSKGLPQSISALKAWNKFPLLKQIADHLQEKLKVGSELSKALLYRVSGPRNAVSRMIEALKEIEKYDSSNEAPSLILQFSVISL